MFKGSFGLFVILTATAVVYLEAQSTKLLTAPSFYIAANLEVKGASNLPPGSRLSVTLSDFVGFASTILSEDAIVVLNKDGFFQVTLKPLHGKQFRHNMVCDLSFDPNAVQQDASVLKITGKKGQLLGIDNNG